MSENKNDAVEDVIDVPEITETKGDDGIDTTDWKALAEMNRDLALKNRGIAQRFKTKFEKTKDEFANPISKNEPTSNDLGERAYLAVNGIKSADEVEFFQRMKKETGKDVSSLLDSTYFQTEFRDFKEKKTADNATPTGSKRSNNSQVDSVEFWLAKDELPPASEVDLRRKVVNAKMEKEKTKGVFYNS